MPQGASKLRSREKPQGLTESGGILSLWIFLFTWTPQKDLHRSMHVTWCLPFYGHFSSEDIDIYIKVFKHLHEGLRALKVQKSPQSTGFGVKMPTWRPKCRWQGISVENPSLPLAILPRMGSAGALLRPN
eukprot:s399_g31.t1